MIIEYDENADPYTPHLLPIADRDPSLRLRHIDDHLRLCHHLHFVFY